MASAAHAAKQGRSLTLRSKLYVLLLVATVPLVALAIAFGAFLVQQRRETARQEATGRMLAMVTAVDTAVAGSEAALRALARSAGPAGGGLQGFPQGGRPLFPDH